LAFFAILAAAQIFALKGYIAALARRLDGARKPCAIG
jgi:hypothetical protein